MPVPINSQIPFFSTVVPEKETNLSNTADVNTVTSLFLNVLHNVSIETDSKSVGNGAGVRIYKADGGASLGGGSVSDFGMLERAVDAQDGSGDHEKTYALADEFDLQLINSGTRTSLLGMGSVQDGVPGFQILLGTTQEGVPVTFNEEYRSDFDINFQEGHTLSLDRENPGFKLENFDSGKTRRLDTKTPKIVVEQGSLNFDRETLHQDLRLKDLPKIDTNLPRNLVADASGETESLINDFTSKSYNFVLPIKKKNEVAPDAKNRDLSQIIENRPILSKDVKFPRKLALNHNESTITKFVVLGKPSEGQVWIEAEKLQFSLGKNPVYQREINGEVSLNLKRDNASKDSLVNPRFFNKNHTGLGGVSHPNALEKKGKGNINEPPSLHEVGLEELFSEEIEQNTKLYRMDYHKIENFRVLEIDPFLNMKLKIKDIKEFKNQPSNFLNPDLNIVSQNVNSINLINNVVNQSNSGESLEPWLDSLIETDRRQWADRLTDQIKTSFRSGSGNAIELRLHPASLGKLMVSIVQTDKGFAIRIHTQTHAASKLVTDSDGKLTMLLSEAGLKLESLRVVSDNFAGRSFENNFGAERQNENSKGSGRSPFDETGEKAEEDKITLVGEEVVHLPKGYKYKIDIYV